MSKHTEFGRKGEEIAVRYLQEKGYEILQRNYRYKRAEIDIIAQKEDLLIFVEVKARKRVDFGYPEDAVNERKIELIQEAAESFLEDYKWQQQISFDIISIISKNNSYEIFHIEDAF